MEQIPPQPFLRIFTFGRFHIEYRDQTGTYQNISSIRRQSKHSSGLPLTLLKLLLCQVHRTATTDRILEALWPDREEGQAKKRLQDAASDLRALVRGTNNEHPILTMTSHSAAYKLAGYPFLWCDADAFLWNMDHAMRLLPQNQEALPLLARAAELSTQGIFLPEDTYHDWSQARRTMLEGKTRQCMLLLAQCYQDLGYREQAVYQLQAYLNQHPYDEEVARHLIALLTVQGQWQEANKLYQQCAQALAEEELPASPEMEQWGEILTTTLQRIGKANSFGNAHPHMVHSEVAPMTWLAAKQESIVLLVKEWVGRAVYCDQLQTYVHQELAMIESVTGPASESQRVSRRRVLSSLAALPLLTLIASTASAPTMEPVEEPHPTRATPPSGAPIVSPEEFLPSCTASIEACWFLLNSNRGEDLHTIENTLPRYLPNLLSLAQKSTRYQTQAAHLASQACLLMDLLSYHRSQFQACFTYAHRAVELACLSRDPHLEAFAYLLKGGAANLLEKPQQMLALHQRALSHIGDLVPALQSYLFAELAYAYAVNGKTHEALNSIAAARDAFPTTYHNVPTFVSADYPNESQLIVFEGLTHLTLGKTDADHAPRHMAEAQKALNRIDTIPHDVAVPQRLKLEIVNMRAQAALGQGEFEAFTAYTNIGAQGAILLGSEKRKSEVRKNISLANQRWPGEHRLAPWLQWAKDTIRLDPGATQP